MKKRLLPVILALIIVCSMFLALAAETFAAAAPTLSLNVISETSSSVTLGVKLESGSFNAIDFRVKGNSSAIGKCTAAYESDEFSNYIMREVKKSGGAGASAVYADTGFFSGAVTVPYAKTGTYIVIYIFSKNSSANVRASDFSFAVESCKVGDTFLTAKAVNRLPTTIVTTTTTTRKPTTTTTKKTTTTQKPTTTTTRKTTTTQKPTTTTTRKTTTTQKPTATTKNNAPTLPETQTTTVNPQLPNVIVTQVTETTSAPQTTTTTEPNTVSVNTDGEYEAAEETESFNGADENAVITAENTETKETKNNRIGKIKSGSGLSDTIKKILIICIVIIALLLIVIIVMIKLLSDRKAKERNMQNGQMNGSGWEDQN